MNNPNFITFTGIDASTDIPTLFTLNKLYPVEFGILYSEVHSNHTDHPRYPHPDVVSSFFNQDLRLALHLCGSVARQIVTTGIHKLPFDVANFERVQLNVPPNLITEDSLHTVNEWAKFNKLWNVIIQARGDEFPQMKWSNIQFLLDRSGGKGIVLSGDDLPKIPDTDKHLMHGYAGGITPANVMELVNVLRTRDQLYWIDMETGVRNEEDHLDLAKCWDVCQQVYGV